MATRPIAMIPWRTFPQMYLPPQSKISPFFPLPCPFFLRLLLSPKLFFYRLGWFDKSFFSHPCLLYMLFLSMGYGWLFSFIQLRLRLDLAPRALNAFNKHGILIWPLDQIIHEILLAIFFLTTRSPAGISTESAHLGVA